MASSPEDTIQEEREALMVSPTGGIPTSRTAHFLRPTVASPQGVPPISLPFKPTISDFKKTPSQIQFKDRRYPPEKWQKWVDRLLPIYQNTWKKVGIYEAILACTYNIPRDNDLVIKLADRWCVETNTFNFPWGEATVSLEDMMVLGGFSVLGDSVSRPLETNEMREIEISMRKARIELRSPNFTRQATSSLWMDHFMASGSQFEHEAFLSLWLSRFVLCSSTTDFITMDVFPVAIRLSKGTPVALAPVVLASLYRDLSSLKQLMVDLNKLGAAAFEEGSKIKLRAPVQLVQIWAWERFPTLQPLPNVIKFGEPRMARWHKLKRGKVENLRLAIDSAGESFQWRPYATVVNNGMLSKFYRENEEWVEVESCMDKEIESLARCLRACELVGLDCIQQYFPHRVAMQFGLDQDLPGHVPRCNERPETAWINYNKPIRDAKLYIPPRLFESDVTTRYLEWWKQFVSAREDAIKGVVRQRRTSTYKRLPRASWGNKEHIHIFAPPAFLSKRNIVEATHGTEDERLAEKHDNIGDGLAGEVKPMIGTLFRSSLSAKGDVAVGKMELPKKTVEMNTQSSTSMGGTKIVSENPNKGKANILSNGINKNEEASSYGETEIPGLELEDRISKLEIVVAGLKATKFGLHLKKKTSKESLIDR